MDLNNITLRGVGKKKKKMSRRATPTKRSINLATAGEQPLNLRIAVPALALIIVGAILLSKFAVVDRLMAVSRAQGEVAALQAQLNQGYAAVKEVGDISERYAHYTYSGMTQEELQRPDRVKVLQLLQKVVIPQAQVVTWTVSGNLLTLNLNRSSLQEINVLVQELNEHQLVDYCTVTTASTGGSVESGARVNAQVLVYLKQGPVESEEESAEESEQDLAGEAIDAVTDTVVGGVAGDLVGDLQANREESEERVNNGEAGAQ